MKFGFYVSRNATRMKKTLRYLKNSEAFSPLLRDFGFVYRDCEKSDELPDLCRENGISCCQHEMASIERPKQSNAVSAQLLTLMKQTDTDALFVFGARLLKGPLLQAYRNRIINFHPSLLPAFPGMNAIDQARNYGSFLMGNTAHFVDEGIDTGPIIMQNICVVHGTVDYDFILDKQILMLIQIILWLREGRIHVSGRHVHVEGGVYGTGSFVPNLERNELTTMDAMPRFRE